MYSNKVIDFFLRVNLSIKVINVNKDINDIKVFFCYSLTSKLNLYNISKYITSMLLSKENKGADYL